MRYTERYLLFCLPSVIYIYQVDKIIETHFTVYYTLQLNSSTDSIVTDDTPLYNNVNKTVCITFMRVGSLQHCCIRHYSFFARGIYSNIQQLCVGTWMHTEKCAVSSSTIRLIQWCQSDLTKKSSRDIEDIIQLFIRAELHSQWPQHVNVERLFKCSFICMQFKLETVYLHLINRN